MSCVFVVFLTCALLQVDLVLAQWSYDTSDATNGPSGWVNTYADCGLNSQSPIDIVTTSVTTNNSLDSLAFANYDDTSVTMTLVNGGYGALLTVTGATLTLSGGGLPEEFTYATLHFHWGATDTTGSEHTLDGIQYPLELHVIHYANSDGSFAAAQNQVEGLAVLGIFFEISSTDNPNLDNLLTAWSSLAGAGTSTTVASFSIYDLISDALGPYWRYSGSMTEPECYESIIWTVYERKLPVSASQLSTFRTIQGVTANPLTYNYRPVQALNGRTVSYYPDNGATSSIAASLTLLSVTSALQVLLLHY